MLVKIKATWPINVSQAKPPYKQVNFYKHTSAGSRPKVTLPMPGVHYSFVYLITGPKKPEKIVLYTMCMLLWLIVNMSWRPSVGSSHIHYLLYGDIMTWSKQTRDLAFNIVMFAGPQNKQLKILAGCLNLTHFQSKKDQELCRRLQPRYILRSFAIIIFSSREQFSAASVAGIRNMRNMFPLMNVKKAAPLSEQQQFCAKYYACSWLTAVGYIAITHLLYIEHNLLQTGSDRGAR